VKGRVVPVRSLAEHELASWSALARRSAEANPLNERGVVLAAARHQTNGADLQLALVEERGSMLAALPVVRAPRLGNIVVPVLTTNIRRMTYLGTPLVDPDAGVTAATTLLRSLRGRTCPKDPGILVVQWLAEDGPVAGWLRAAAESLRCPVFVYEDFEQPFLERHADGTLTESTSKRHRKDYERRARRMSEELGARLELVDRADDPGAVTDFLAMEAAGYKTGNGVAMVTQDGEPAYFAEMCRTFAGDGRLHVLELRAGSRPVAMQISLRAADTLFLIKVAHDESLGRYDPGIQLHLRAVEFFRDRTDAAGLRVCTFADNELLLRLYPDRRRVCTLVVGLGGPVDRALVRTLPAARSLSRGVRRGFADRRRVSTDRRRPPAVRR